MKLFTAPPLSHLSAPPAQAGGPEIGPKTGPGIAPGGSQGAATPAERRATLLLPEPPSQPRVVAIPRLAQGGRWRVEAMRALSEPCLLWFTRGQGRITLGGVTRGYGAHNAIFIPAGVMHGFDPGTQTHGQAVFFGRGSDMILPPSAQHLRIREAGPQAELSAIIDAITRELDGHRPGADRAARHHLGLLGVWLERQVALAQAETPAPRPNAARRLVARYAALLERDFRSGLGVADFAAELGVTPTHLSRVCRETCGRPASDLLQDRRLYEARRLLTETRAPVQDIARTLGFASAAYFTRAFHAKTGKTPSDFRRAG
ncbi:AraC family transcriptional regulator [Phaeovulum sp. NW3]|uniref:helix-turn-helix domain-containing protein n=1 Tax=Phaeovulum sp. NW3 TaxID=2934933 RepID=UPI0020225224|nr:AraC family transcriptional regulator [Phaeovulum sp. NW3]